MHQQQHTTSCWLEGNIHQPCCTDSVIGDYIFKPQYIAILLRIGDLCDIDEQRAPNYIFNKLKLDIFSIEEWQQHYSVINTKKIITDETTSLKQVIFEGETSEKSIFRKINKYIDYVSLELSHSVIISEKYNDKYKLSIKPYDVNNVKPVGFSASNMKLNLDYIALTNLLMGEKIYGDNKYGLRELLQNSIDACKLMNEIEERNSFATGDLNTYNPKILLVINEITNKVSIIDNGTGMSIESLKNYFLNVGKSYYKSREFYLKGYDYNPIGNFGVGFLACFMLSDVVNIQTKSHEEAKGIEVSLEKDNEYVIISDNVDIRDYGTKIDLDYANCMKHFSNKTDEIIRFVEENFIIDKVSIEVVRKNNSGVLRTQCQSKPLDISKMKNLNSYLNGLEVYSTKGNLFMKCNLIEEIIKCDPNNIYEYDQNKGSIIAIKSHKVKDYVNDENTLSYIEVPVINGDVSNRFDSLLEG